MNNKLVLTSDELEYVAICVAGFYKILEQSDNKDNKMLDELDRIIDKITSAGEIDKAYLLAHCKVHVERVF